MNEDPNPTNKGWFVGRSIVMELDVALTGMHGSDWSATFQKEFPSLIENLPESMLVEWQKKFGRSRGWISFLETLGFLADVFMVDDYQQATLSMRGITIIQALTRLKELAMPYGLTANPDQTNTEQLIELGTALFPRLYSGIGLELTSLSAFNKNTRRDLAQLCRILKDGDRHDWFWMWLDRFYYETYNQWRKTRFELMNQKEAQALLVLGAKTNKGVAPRIDWLPEQNPLHMEPAYIEAARSGKLEIFFWVDPFGLADNWSLYPGFLAVSFSEPGEMYKHFFQNTEELARRVQALADPTRLGILRIIRHFGMINTEIGKFMGISRPTVSIHAKLLRKAGLIRSKEQGRETRHEIVPGEIQHLFHDLERFLDLEEEVDDK